MYQPSASGSTASCQPGSRTSSSAAPSATRAGSGGRVDWLTAPSLVGAWVGGRGASVLSRGSGFAPRPGLWLGDGHGQLARQPVDLAGVVAAVAAQGALVGEPALVGPAADGLDRHAQPLGDLGGGQVGAAGHRVHLPSRCRAWWWRVTSRLRRGGGAGRSTPGGRRGPSGRCRRRTGTAARGRGSGRRRRTGPASTPARTAPPRRGRRAAAGPPRSRSAACAGPDATRRPAGVVTEGGRARGRCRAA